MEIFLNFAWVLLAGVLVRQWLCHAPRESASRRVQVAAVAMLILILLPVISVTDDLQTAQSPAEVTVYMRRGHTAVSPHSIHFVVAMLPPVIFVGLFSGYQRLAAPFRLSIPTVENPALAAIQNRPPPTA